MLARIVRHEWRALAADRSLAWAGALIVAVVAYGVWNGVAWTRAQAGEAAAAREAYAKRIAELRADLARPRAAGADAFAPDPGAPRTVGGVRQDVFLPQGPLAALSVGQSDLLPGRVSVSIWSARRSPARNYEVQNPLNLLAGRFDLAFAVVYLFPLVILALSYNLLSGERDQGTLALLLSQPVALASFVWGKVAARFLLVLALGLLVPLAGIVLAGAELGQPGAWGRLLLWALAVVVYGSFWFALAVLVSALGRSSAANAVVLASAWLGLVVVIPSLVGLAASSLYPVPSRALLVHAMRQASNEASQKGSRLLEKYFQDHPELVAGGKPDFDDFTTRYLAMEADVEAAVAPVLERHERALAAQQAFVSRLRLLSPAMTVREALDDAAGTGLARHRAFFDQAWAFAEATKAFFAPRVYRQERLVEADYDAIPRFAFVEERAGEAARRVLGGLLFVAGVTLLFGWLGLRALARYPVAG